MAKTQISNDENGPIEPSHAIPENPLVMTSFPPVSCQHVDNCRFSSWYPRFRAVTLKSRIINPLPKEFVDYLNADGLFLPLDSDGLPQPSYQAQATRRDSDSDGENEGSTNWSDDEDDQSNIPAFPELQNQINDIIEELGGSIFPKLNWSSPKDATWIATGNTLRCRSPADIFLLLKSSDFVAHDLSHVYEICDSGEEESQSNAPATFELVLRKWFDLLPSMEFRCFVKNKTLIAICQRDAGNFYPFLDSMKDEYSDYIEDFFDDHVSDNFPDPHFVFDVYISRVDHRVFLVDFNPFAKVTDTLLYTWDEILSATTLTFRVVRTQVEANMASQYSTSRVPKYAIDAMTSNSSLQELAAMLQGREQPDATDNE